MKQKNMDSNKVIDGDLYNYRSEEIALSEATRITNKKTGATVKLTPNVKAAYKVMRYRYSYFSTEHQGYFDNQDDIAAGCSLGLSTIERSLPVLASAGLIEIESITLAKDKRSNSYVVHNINPDDFLLERKDKKLGWVNCLECPVFGSTRLQEPQKAEEQETEAVTETSPQEPQQPETNPALPSSDDIHTSADSLSDDVPKPTGKVNLIFTPYNPAEEEDENYGEDEEELEYWEIVDESPPSQTKPSPISQAMRSQFSGQNDLKKGVDKEYIPF